MGKCATRINTLLGNLRAGDAWAVLHRLLFLSASWLFKGSLPTDAYAQQLRDDRARFGVKKTTAAATIQNGDVTVLGEPVAFVT
jgi:hypothetical protein